MLLDRVSRTAQLHYLIAHNPDWNLAGTFHLYFIWPRKEPMALRARVIVTKDGFLFCNRRLKSFNKVIQYLKENLASIVSYVSGLAKKRESRWKDRVPQQLLPAGYMQQQQHQQRMGMGMPAPYNVVSTQRQPVKYDL